MYLCTLHLCRWESARTYARVCIWKPEFDAECFFSLSLPCILRQSLSLNLDCSLGWLANKLMFSPTQPWDDRHMPPLWGLYVAGRDINSGLLVLTILSTVLSSQVQIELEKILQLSCHPNLCPSLEWPHTVLLVRRSKSHCRQFIWYRCSIYPSMWIIRT